MSVEKMEVKMQRSFFCCLFSETGLQDYFFSYHGSKCFLYFSALNVKVAQGSFPRANISVIHNSSTNVNSEI